MMKFKRGKVLIDIQKGEKEPHKDPVDSWSMGDFSYWGWSTYYGKPTTFDDKDCLFQITHNPTGLCVKYDIPDEREAREIIRKLALVPERWNGREEMPAEFERKVKEILRSYL